MDRVAPSAIYILALWLIHLSGAYTVMGLEGNTPQVGGYIPNAVSAALLHINDDHLYGNIKGLAPLLIGLALVERKPWMTLLVLIFIPGIVLWFFGPVGSGPHLGASDVIYALVGFLLIHGIRKSDFLSLGIAGAVLFYEGAKTLAAIQPDGSGSSWEGHLAGLIVGLAWGFLRPNKAG